MNTSQGKFRWYSTLIMLAGLIFSLLVPFVDTRALPQTEPLQAGPDPVIAAAGDIACDPTNSHFNGGMGDTNNCRQKYTSDLLVNAGLAAVLDLGDNQYYCGGYQAFLQSYDLSWGRVKSITHPAVGNHEYLTSGGTDCNINNEGATGHFTYFGSAAGAPGKGYYSFDVGSWHIIAINSNCSDVGGCSSGSPQYQWLQADLAAHQNLCTLAYWHIPLFSSGGRAASNTKAFWQLLYNNHADLILNGHDHIYERFAPMDPTGAVDNARGMREFIVGTGGSDHTSIPGAIAANSEVRNINTYGVLKLTLHATGYDWQFVPEAGKTFSDSGSTNCHAALPDVTPPSAPANLTTTALSWNQVGLSWTASTDNVGVTGYQVYRNGTLIKSTSSTSYTDTTAQPQTAYSYYVKAFDAAGVVSAASNTVNVTTLVAPIAISFNVLADAYIQSDAPTVNTGTASQLVTDNSPVKDMLLRFNVSGINPQDIVAVKLRLYCVDGSAFGGEIHRVADSNWSETAVNWNNAPAADSAILGTVGSVSAGTWIEADITSLVNNNGTYSLRVRSTSSDGAYYVAKEGAPGQSPQLVVYVNGPTPTPTFTPSPTLTFTPTTSGPIVFNDGFESNNLSNWTSVQGLITQNQEVDNGSYAARATSAAGNGTYARKQLSSTQSDLYYRIRLKVLSQGPNNVSILKFRTASDTSILSVGINSLGQLSYHNDLTNTTATSSTVVPKNAWQTLQVHVRIADTASQVEVWYNDTLVSALTKTEALGTTPIGRLQLGENTPALTYDVAFDDISAATTYISTVSTPTITPTRTATLTSTPVITLTPTNTITPTGTTTSGAALTFAPIADTYVQSDTATTNYGNATQFVTDSSPVRHMLLKFAVSGVGSQTIVNAKLRLYCVDGSPVGGEFHRVADSSWNESTVNWNNAPAADSSILATLGKVSSSKWYEVDVTPLINGDGTYSIKILSNNTDGAYYSAREGTAGFAPQLVITTAASPITTTPTASLTPSPTITASATITASPVFTSTSTSTFTPTPTSEPVTYFSDGFESGDLSQWDLVQSLTVQTDEVAGGSYAARATSNAGSATYARKFLSTPQNDLYVRLRFKLISQGANTINLLKLRTATDTPILSVSVNNLGQLSYRNDLTGTSVNSSTTISQGTWQTLQVHLLIADTASQIQVWYNDDLVGVMSGTDSFGVTPIGRVQLGENTPALTYDVAFDDVSAASFFLTDPLPGPVPTASPTPSSNPEP